MQTESLQMQREYNIGILSVVLLIFYFLILWCCVALPLATRAWVTAMLTTEKGTALEKDTLDFTHAVFNLSTYERQRLTPVPEALLVAFSEHSPLFLCGDVLHAHLCLHNNWPPTSQSLQIC